MKETKYRNSDIQNVAVVTIIDGRACGNAVLCTRPGGHEGKFIQPGCRLANESRRKVKSWSRSSICSPAAIPERTPDDPELVF